MSSFATNLADRSYRRNESPISSETHDRSSRTGVLLVHGLGGTEFDLGLLGRQLRQQGLDTHTLTLPGHGGQPRDLLGVRLEDWIHAVRERYQELRRSYAQVHLMGMCMGALLAIEVARLERLGESGNGKLVALAPPVFIDGWSTPWYRGLRYLFYAFPRLANRIRIHEENPYGIKNERLRAIVKSRLAKGDGFHYPWVPLSCIAEVDRLRQQLKRGLKAIACATLVVHAREDELTSMRSAHFLVDRINAGTGGRAQMIMLENSYHMICVDNDRQQVADSVIEFLGA